MRGVADRTVCGLVLSVLAWALAAGGAGCAAHAAACNDPSQRRGVERSVGGKGVTSEAILSAACASQVDALLLVAVAEHESGLDPAARGPNGGVGLFQVRAPTARELSARHGWRYAGEKTLLEPQSNARIAAAYLASMHSRFGSWEAALSAYNLGPARVQSLMRKGKPATSAYARAILGSWKHLREELAE